MSEPHSQPQPAATPLAQAPAQVSPAPPLLGKSGSMTIDMLILWVIENPGTPYKEAARLFGVRPQWIYTITSSDMFKARLQVVLREKGVGTTTCVADLHAKLAGLIEMSIDKLTEKLAESDDPKFIFEVATRLLANRGGAQVAVQVNDNRVTNNVSFQVDARTVAVADARAATLARARAELEARPALSPGEILAQPVTVADDAA